MKWKLQKYLNTLDGRLTTANPPIVTQILENKKKKKNGGDLPIGGISDDGNGGSVIVAEAKLMPRKLIFKLYRNPKQLADGIRAISHFFRTQRTTKRTSEKNEIKIITITIITITITIIIII
uniref:Uncharacterized protein n=1 Tax=Vespula pensylvanica TaxID=30213 RepID=A0A834P9X2_VESPE|nr:hypothetical protein H0235_002408 [Vespula pensylvanica]